MKRRLLNLLTALSLLLCVAVAALWAASYWLSPRLYVGHHGGTTGTGLNVRWTPGAVECVAIRFESEPGRAAIGFNASAGAERWRDGMIRRSAWVRGGFGLHPWQSTVTGHGPTYTNYYWGLSLPSYVPAILFGFGPALRWNRRRYRRRCMTAGLCPRCGYDLRATPDKCPECGTTASVTPSV